MHIILIDADPPSLIFNKKKEEAAREVGIEFRLHQFKKEVKEEEISSLISNLNSQDSCHGIVIHFPLPKELNREKILAAISDQKDVDGLTPKSRFIPAVALAVLEILKFYKIRLKEKKVVVLGKGRYVGQSIGDLLRKEGGKVIFCTRKTKNIPQFTKKADILVSAVGQPHLVKKEMVREGAVVIDVGTAFKGGKLVGDCDFEKIKKVAGFISPVPGGIGPLTVACLLENTIRATKLLTKNKI